MKEILEEIIKNRQDMPEMATIVIKGSEIFIYECREDWDYSGSWKEASSQ